MPARIGAFLRVVRVLVRYGHHLAETVQHRALAPGFGAIAACFGTADLAVIHSHLRRGILRALALERVLLARAARGRDIGFVKSRSRTARGKPRPADADAGQQPADPAVPTLVRHSSPHSPADVHVLTLEEIEAQVRRRPLGRTIVDICLDLAVMPGFCTGAFWNELFELTRCYGGSIGVIVRERCRREQAFDREQDRDPAPDWNWPNPGRETIRQALGFFIGEPPVAPFHFLAPARAAATGPP